MVKGLLLATAFLITPLHKIKSTSSATAIMKPLFLVFLLTSRAIVKRIQNIPPFPNTVMAGQIKSPIGVRKVCIKFNIANSQLIFSHRNQLLKSSFGSFLLNISIYTIYQYTEKASRSYRKKYIFTRWLLLDFVTFLAA